jgi:hypothetical protein
MNVRSDLLSISLLALLYALQGCGGGGGSSNEPADTGDTETPTEENEGSEGQAQITESNAKDLAISAASAVKQGVDENGIALPIQSAARAANYAPMGTSDSSQELCQHGGSAIVEFNDSTDQITTATFTDCSYGGGLYLYTFTGVVNIEYADGSDESAFTSVHDGVLTSVDGVTHTILRTYSCEANHQNCNFISDFVGFDDRSYRVTDISVTEDGNAAYTAEGRVYDPSHGYIDVVTEVPVTFECEDGHPGVGRLSFTGMNETSGTIEFVSCTEYVVTTSSGTSNNYNW